MRFLSDSGCKYTEDAYIDYNNMKIVPEVQGDSVDFTKVAKDIAEKKLLIINSISIRLIVRSLYQSLRLLQNRLRMSLNLLRSIFQSRFI